MSIVSYANASFRTSCAQVSFRTPCVSFIDTATSMVILCHKDHKERKALWTLRLTIFDYRSNSLNLKIAAPKACPNDQHRAASLGDSETTGRSAPRGPASMIVHSPAGDMPSPFPSARLQRRKPRSWNAPSGTEGRSPKALAKRCASTRARGTRIGVVSYWGESP